MSCTAGNVGTSNEKAKLGTRVQEVIRGQAGSEKKPMRRGRRR